MDQANLSSASLSLPIFVKELRCMIGKVESLDNDNHHDDHSSSIKSSYHWTVLKCRSLINELPEIIASPMNETEGNIYIVTRGEFFKTEKLRNVFRNMNLQCLRFVEVTRKVFEACLKYTVLFHVAPAWNRVDCYLSKGRDFLTLNRRIVEAIKLNVILKDDQARFIVSPARIEIHHLTLEYFLLPTQVIDEFINNETGFIEFKDEKSRAWVHVLPSLKKGRVMSVSKRIPESSPFKNYQQLRRHWKNMYGYRLPNIETGLIYYQVYFPWAGEDCYTYPNCCLSPAKPVNLSLDRSKNTAEEFLNDLTERMPKLFGTSLKLKGLNFGINSNKAEDEESDKENIPKNRSSIEKNLDKIWKLQVKPLKVKCETTTGLEFDKNNINRSIKSYDSERKNETVARSSQSVKTESDELTIASLRNEDNIVKDEEWFSLLRSRSSFDFNEFSKTLDGRDPFDEMISGNLNGQDNNRGRIEIDNGDLEIKSRFFDNIDEESSAGDFIEVENKSDESKLPFKRIRLDRISDKKLKVSSIKSSVINSTSKVRRSEINFKTRDISSYFIVKKVRNSNSQETDAKNFDQPQTRTELLIGGEEKKE